jgi:hypothetical protein
VAAAAAYFFEVGSGVRQGRSGGSMMQAETGAMLLSLPAPWPRAFHGLP